jgi:hypothetical protein
MDNTFDIQGNGHDRRGLIVVDKDGTERNMPSAYEVQEGLNKRVRAKAELAGDIQGVTEGTRFAYEGSLPVGTLVHGAGTYGISHGHLGLVEKSGEGKAVRLLSHAELKPRCYRIGKGTALNAALDTTIGAANTVGKFDTRPASLPFDIGSLVCDDDGTIGFVEKITWGASDYTTDIIVRTLMTMRSGEGHILSRSWTNSVRFNEPAGMAVGESKTTNDELNKYLCFDDNMIVSDAGKPHWVAFGVGSEKYDPDMDYTYNMASLLLRMEDGYKIKIDRIGGGYTSGTISNELPIATSSEPGTVITRDYDPHHPDDKVTVLPDGSMLWEGYNRDLSEFTGALIYIGYTTKTSKEIDKELAKKPVAVTATLDDIADRFNELNHPGDESYAGPQIGYCAVTEDNKAYIYNADGKWIDIGNPEVRHATNERFGLVKGSHGEFHSGEEPETIGYVHINPLSGKMHAELGDTLKNFRVTPRAFEFA